MKKGLLILGTVFFLNTKSQELKTNCEAPSGSTVLGYQEVVKYVNNYHRNHDRSLENHTKALYINDTAILFLDRFFSDASNDKYFGFCVYFISYNYNVNGKHQHKIDQTFLYLTPVYYRDPTNKKDTVADYAAFDKFYEKVKGDETFKKMHKLNNSIPCYGTCDSSINKWIWGDYAPQINFTRLHNMFINDKGNSEVFLLTKNRSSHGTRRKNYENGQGAELNKSQTQRAYFNKSTILKLAEFIKSDDNRIKFPMMGVYLASYNMIKEGTQQKNPYQTTAIFIPMRKMDDNNLEPDICTYVTFYKQRIEAKDKIFMLSENHGTLCPTQCPSGGN